MPRGSMLQAKAQYIYIPISIKMKAMQIGYWSVASDGARTLRVVK